MKSTILLYLLLLFTFNTWIQSETFTAFLNQDHLNFETGKILFSENNRLEIERKTTGLDNILSKPVVFNQSISGFILINASSDADIFSINNGDVISLASLPSTKLSIRANTAPENVGSVKFELSGPQVRTYIDNTAPYSLFGDDGNGNYYFGFWAPPTVGSYTLKVTPYTLSNAKGTAGLPTTINFTIVESSTPPQDQIAPVVNSINRHIPTQEQTIGGNLIYRVLFSEAVSGVDNSDFSLTTSGTATGTISTIQAVNTSTFDVSIQNASGTGTLRLDLNATNSGIADGSGNALNESFSSGAAYSIAPPQDQEAPQVSSILRHIPIEEQTTGGTLIFRVLFSESVNGVDASDFSLALGGSATGTISNMVQVNGNTYDVSILNASGAGTLRLDLNASGSGITDANGNALTQSFISGQAYNLVAQDETAPVVSVINRHSPLNAETSGGTLVYRVLFSEAVTGVDAADFALTLGGTVTGTINSQVGAIDGLTYEVSISGASGTGTLRLDLNATGSGISDVANNPLTQSYTSGQVYNLAQPSPVQYTLSINENENGTVSKSPEQASYNEGSKVSITAIPKTGYEFSGWSGDVSGKTNPVEITMSSNKSVSATFTTASTGQSITSFILVNASIDVDLQTIANGSTISLATLPTTKLTIRVNTSPNVVGSVRFEMTGPTNRNFIDNNAPYSLFGDDGSSNFYYGTWNPPPLGAYTLTVTPYSSTNGGGTAGTPSTISFTIAENEPPQNDQSPPTVLSINRLLPSNQSTSNTSVTFRTTFSETVTGVDVNDFTLKGTATGNIAAVSGSGSVYDISINSITGTGSLGIDLKSSGTGIADVSGNAITSGFTSGQTYNIQTTQTVVGFKTITKLNNLTITSSSTGEKPQAKVWMYAGRHWAVLANSSGTFIWRLDGKTWTNVLKVSTKTTTRADCKVVGNVVHIFLYQGRTSQFVSVEYDSNNTTYVLWKGRTTIVGLSLESGVETATIDMDSKGRMWLANTGTTGVHVRWSDAPYNNWSAPITIATGINDDDICAVVALPGKIGVLWSNQNTERFGFKTHTDGASPSDWSSDEVPASQSALNVGNGMADDHLNVVAASDGTLYCAVKTSYDITGYPRIALLVRHNNGTWDNLYNVEASRGTRPIVVLNEVKGKVRVVYSKTDNGGDILYNETSTSNISFGSQLTLISGSSINNPTSTKQTFDPEVVIMASSGSTATSVLASDADAITTNIVSQKSIQKDVEVESVNHDYKVFPNIVKRGAPIQLQSSTSQLKEAVIVDAYGRVINNLSFTTSIAVATDKLQNGTYFITIMEKQNKKVYKFIVVP